MQLAAIPTDAEPYRDRIRAELLAVVCKRLPTILLVEAVLAPLLIVTLLWEVADALQILLWMAPHVLVIGLHAYTYRQFRRAATSLRLAWLFTVGMSLAGVYWAVLLAYMFAVIPDYLYHLYMFLFLGGLGVLAVAVIGEASASVYCFIAPPTLALAAISLRMNHYRYAMLAVVGVLTMSALCLFARAKHRGAVDALLMRFAIGDLADELRKQRDAAEQASVAKSKFLAAASHDLRQPMHALTLLSEALQEATRATTTGVIAGDIRAAVGSMEKMFDALLDVSRLDAGILQPSRVHFRLDELLQRVAAEYALEAQAKGVALECEVVDGVAYSDPLLIERIVRNYLSNAVRYTNAGRITLRVLSSDNGWRIEVRDTGIGIPGERQRDIFDEYTQIDNPERDRTKGLGLGLAIVRRIAQLLDLPFGVESTLGRGSCFFVELPKGNATMIRDSASRGARLADVSGVRVVVIDDDAAIRDAMRALLTQWGCEYVIVDDEDAAVAALRGDDARIDARVDAIIADFRLREQRTGIQAVARLRAEFGADIPALLVSGDTSPERLREVAESGLTLVHKPAPAHVLRVFLANARRHSILA